MSFSLRLSKSRAKAVVARQLMTEITLHVNCDVSFVDTHCIDEKVF